MRVVVDTNVLVSALLSSSSLPAELLSLWRDGRFTLLTAPLQLEELMRISRYPKLKLRLTPSLIGRLINELRDLAEKIEPLIPVDVSPDPYDNYLLAIASDGRANYLISGDKRDLLSLGTFKGALILSVSDFLATMKRRR